MALKRLLGLEGTNITDREIATKIRDAMRKKQGTITFTSRNGKKITIKLPSQEFTKYIDPWDGNPGKNNYPRI